MRNSLITFMALLTLGFTMLAQAHHSHSSIDRDWKVSYAGTVTEFMWRAPHVYLKIDSIMPETGEVVEYTIETLNPSSLQKTGWRRETLQPGDRVIWAGNHDRDPDRAYGSLDYVQKVGGYTYFVDEGEMEAYLERENIDWDAYMGLTPLKPAESLAEGVWSRSRADGSRFPPIRGPQRDWPLTEKGQELVANFSEDNNPILDCEYPGPPKSITAPLYFRHSMADEDTLLIERALMDNQRYIHLNPETAPGPGERTNVGYSVGHYEGDTLVVETTNFKADRWGLWTGIDSSEQKHMIERYWLSDEGMRLNVEITVTDPEYLTEPVTFTHHWTKVQDFPITQAECSMENANYYLTAGYEEE